MALTTFGEIAKAFWAEVVQLWQLGPISYQSSVISWLRAEVSGAVAWAVELYVTEDLTPYRGALHVMTIKVGCLTTTEEELREYIEETRREAEEDVAKRAVQYGVPAGMAVEEFRKEWEAHEASAAN